MFARFRLSTLLALLGTLTSVCALQAASFVPFSFEVPRSETAALAREISALVKLPDGQTIRLPAYAEANGQTYSVRARASGAGTYRLLEVYEQSGANEIRLPLQSLGSSTVENTDPIQFPQVQIDPQAPNRFCTSAGTPFYPLGMNLAWPDGELIAYYKKAFSDFQKNGLNWTRIWFSNWGGLNLDWTQGDLGESPAPGAVSAKIAENWDTLIEEANHRGVYIQMVLQHHGQYSSKIDSNWGANPWNAANPNGFLKTPSDFFTDAKARQLTRQKYRYIVARWSYAPTVMAWELFNEVYQVDAYIKGDIKAVAAWHSEMADYLRSIDPYKHLITTSLNDIRSPIWEKMDYLQPHLYAANVIDSVRGFYPSLLGITRPIFYGEVGDDAVLLPRAMLNSGEPIISSLWSSLMGESEYPAQPWYPERLLNKERLQNLAGIAHFIAENKLSTRSNLKAFQPAILSDSTVNLVVPAGHWWTRRPIAQINIPTDGSISPEICEIPRAFVGSPDSTVDGFPNRAVIRAHFPERTTAKLRLNDVGGYGAKLNVCIDGQTIISATWAECMKGLGDRPQQTATFNFVVQEGVHEIAIENPGGPDWFDFHSLDLGIKTPALAAVGKRSNDFVMLWVWHRTGLFAPEAAAKAQIQIDALPAGTWSLRWWDTRTGEASPEELITHKGGQFLLSTPTIQKDRAVTLLKQQ